MAIIIWWSTSPDIYIDEKVVTEDADGNNRWIYIWRRECDGCFVVVVDEMANVTVVVSNDLERAMWNHLICAWEYIDREGVAVDSDGNNRWNYAYRRERDGYLVAADDEMAIVAIVVSVDLARATR